MPKILFPLDGSEQAKATIQWASRFLNHQEVSIYLLTVAEAMGMDQNQDSMNRTLDEARNWLEMCGFNVIQADTIINQKAADAICTYAEQQGIDRIIIGSHGQSIAQMLLGSVSQDVMKRACQPVMILKNTQFPAMEISGRGQLNIQQCLPTDQAMRILLPIDSPTSASSLINVAGSLLTGHLELHLLHVVNLATSNLVAVNRALQDSDSLLKSSRQELESNGFRVVAAERRMGNIAEGICQYANEYRIDQIIMASRNRSNFEKFLLGSISASVMKQAKQPVLIFSLGAKTILSVGHANQIKLSRGG